MKVKEDREMNKRELKRRGVGNASEYLKELIRFRNCVFFACEDTEEAEKRELDPDLLKSPANYIGPSHLTKVIYQTIGILENFEKRLKRIEIKLGIYTKEEIKNIKVGGTDPD